MEKVNPELFPNNEFMTILLTLSIGEVLKITKDEWKASKRKSSPISLATAACYQASKNKKNRLYGVRFTGKTITDAYFIKRIR